MKNIPFNKPYLTGKEAHYMYQAVFNGKLSGNGEFTKKCHSFFEERYDFKKVILATSGYCTILHVCIFGFGFRKGGSSYSFC